MKLICIFTLDFSEQRNMETASLPLGPFLTKGIVDIWANNTSSDLRFSDPVIVKVSIYDSTSNRIRD